MNLLSSPYGLSFFGAIIASAIGGVTLMFVRLNKNNQRKQSLQVADRATTIGLLAGLFAFWGLMIIAGLLLTLLLQVFLLLISPTDWAWAISSVVFLIWSGSAVVLFYVLFFGSDPFFEV